MKSFVRQKWFFLVAALMTAAALPACAEPAPLINAHAHNDYEHKGPLVDALARGFTSIEADVFLVDGALLVGHDKKDLRPERTLQALYLDPLRQRAEKNGGRIFKQGPPLTLLVDFKSEGPATYAALAQLLAQYDPLLSKLKDGKRVPSAVDVIVTGNRPIKEISADASRRVTVDGRLADLDNESSPDLIPLISDNWQDFFEWKGEGPMAEEERGRLRQFVKRAHAQKRRLRFWAAPETTSARKELLDAGVDLIGADDLDGLQRFLLHQRSPRQ